MKNQILIILAVLVLLLGCSYSKQNKIESMDANTIMPGKYFGESYNLTSSFIPVLTIDNKHNFILEWGINATTRGTYTVDYNKLILNTIGGENYILEITGHSLKNTQEMPNVRSNTSFKLVKSAREKVTSQSL